VRVVETFSKRLKEGNQKGQDVFKYDVVPPALRVQICHIWRECMGDEGSSYSGRNPIFEQLQKTAAAEFGLFELGSDRHGHAKAIVDFFCEEATDEQALDLIDLSFRMLALHGGRVAWRNLWEPNISYADALEDLNARFMEHGIGYRFVSGSKPQLIKMDNEHLHKEVVLPALQLLHEQNFRGADEEYRKAHEHYRHGRQKECLNECLKSFESTMKTICSKKKWEFKDTDTAKSLIDTCLNNGLLPSFIHSHLGTVRSALESAIPTVRNKLGGHGQGIEPKEVPDFYAEYLLHETAATIVLLISAYKDLA
jgi:AbiJ N-terminal domain 4